MARGQALLARFRSWRVTAALAAGSLIPTVPWRVVTDLAGWLGAGADVLGISLIVGLPAIGASTIGLGLAWLLIAHLTYRYTHLLYPTEYETFVDHTGFRILTALTTLYFGVVVWGSIVSMTVPLQMLPLSAMEQTFGVLMLLFLSGLIGGGLVFGVYLSRWHPEEVFSEESDLNIILGQFVPEDVNRPTHPGRWQSVDRWTENAAFSIFPPIICCLVGIVGVIVNVFYPLPEAVLLVGLVALRVRPETVSTAVTVPQHDVDVRLLDAVSGATRNVKGTIMVMASLLGMAISGVLFFTLVGLVVGVFSSSGPADASTTESAWKVALAGYTLVMLLLAIIMMGVYSLLHWVRQLERIEPYARYWDDDSDDETHDGERTALVTRPPGLLVPAHLLPVGLVLSLVAFSANESFLVVGSILAGSLTVAVVVMGWGLVWTRRHRHDPQPLTYESGALLVTLLLLSGLGMLLGTIGSEGRQIHAEDVLLQVSLMLLISGVYYSPEITYWKLRQKSFRKLLGIVYLGVIVVLFISVVRLRSEGSTLLAESILFSIFAIVLLATSLTIYLERFEE